jgi:hypothetical protein
VLRGSNLGIHTEILRVISLAKRKGHTASNLSLIQRLLVSCFMFLAAFCYECPANQSDVWATSSTLLVDWIGFGVAAEVSVGEVGVCVCACVCVCVCVCVRVCMCVCLCCGTSARLCFACACAAFRFQAPRACPCVCVIVILLFARAPDDSRQP